jgi:hypothetical protein
MKQWVIVVVVIIFSASNVFAQTFEEWFEQKKTQRKYLLEQIAAFQVYLGYVKQGYSIVSGGLQTIGKIKQGDFSLHQDFLVALTKVNPRIARMAKVGDIVVMQTQLIVNTRMLLKNLRNSGQLTMAQLAYCNKVVERLLQDGLKTVEMLERLLKAGEWTLSDGERVEQIDAIYKETQDQYIFSKAFSKECGLLAFQRMGEQQEVDRSRILMGIK